MKVNKKHLPNSVRLAITVLAEYMKKNAFDFPILVRPDSTAEWLDFPSVMLAHLNSVRELEPSSLEE